jgi:hypothetical protein
MKNFWKSARRWLPGVIISLVAIFLIIKFVDLHRLVDAVRSANYWILLAGLAISWSWLAVRGIVWRTLLQKKASYKDIFLTLCEGYLLNNFLPFRLGELGRAFLLGRKAGLSFMEVLPTIVIERVLDLVFSAVILLGTVPFVVGAAGAGRIAVIIGGLVVLGLVFLYLIARNRDWALSRFNRITARWPKLQKQGDDFLAPLFSGLAALNDGALFIRVLLWMSLDWAVGILQFYLMILAFFPQAPLLWAMFGIAAAAFGGAIPSAPGAVGTYEAALGGALTLLSHDQSASLAVAIVAHIFNYLVTGLLGAYALSTEGETLLGVYRQLRRREEEPRPPAVE